MLNGCSRAPNGGFVKLPTWSTNGRSALRSWTAQGSMQSKRICGRRRTPITNRRLMCTMNAALREFRTRIARRPEHIKAVADN